MAATFASNYVSYGGRQPSDHLLFGGKHTGSSEAAATEYSSPGCDTVLTWPRSRSPKGREMPSTKVNGGTGGRCLRAMTLGMDHGVTSDALPIRSQREPGCITSTLEPRLPLIMGKKFSTQSMASGILAYLCWRDGTSLFRKSSSSVSRMGSCVISTPQSLTVRL